VARAQIVYHVYDHQMPPTLTHGKICYVEVPALDIARSADFYIRSSVGGAMMEVAIPHLEETRYS
jgi:hypothetical protein